MGIVGFAILCPAPVSDSVLTSAGDTARGGGCGYGINGETVVATAPEADVSRLPALPSPVGSSVSLPDGVLC